MGLAPYGQPKYSQLIKDKIIDIKSDGSFWLKETASEIFKLFWTNPNYDVTGNGGITGFFQWSDLDFFLIIRI